MFSGYDIEAKKCNMVHYCGMAILPNLVVNKNCQFSLVFHRIASNNYHLLGCPAQICA